MTLEQFAWIGSFMSGLGVIATIIYTATQIRSNTRAVRASAFQEVVDSFASISFDIAIFSCAAAATIPDSAMCVFSTLRCTVLRKLLFITNTSLDNWKRSKRRFCRHFWIRPSADHRPNGSAPDWAQRPRSPRRYPWLTDEISRLHVALVGNLAGFAFTGAVLVVTLLREKTSGVDWDCWLAVVGVI